MDDVGINAFFVELVEISEVNVVELDEEVEDDEEEEKLDEDERMERGKVEPSLGLFVIILLPPVLELLL